MDHSSPQAHQELIKARIYAAYNSDTQRLTDVELEESVNNQFEKGGKRAFVGEIRKFGGRDYIRTTNGWKFHGKGTGVKAQQHVKGANTPISTSTDDSSFGYNKKGVKATHYEHGHGHADYGPAGDSHAKFTPLGKKKAITVDVLELEDGHKEKKKVVKELSTPGKTQTIVASGDYKITGAVKRFNLKDLIPMEDHATGRNDTAKEYAEGGKIFDFMSEKEITVDKLTDPNQLPPILISKDGKIIDGHNRYSAIRQAKLGHINGIQIDQTYDEFVNKKKK